MAIKKFDYAVIYNGKFYPANTPIEVKEPKKKAVTENDEGARTKA